MVSGWLWFQVALAQVKDQMVNKGQQLLAIDELWRLAVRVQHDTALGEWMMQEYRQTFEQAVIAMALRSNGLDPLAAAKKRARRVNANRRARDEAARSCGLVKVRGALGGTYWE